MDRDQRFERRGVRVVPQEPGRCRRRAQDRGRRRQLYTKSGATVDVEPGNRFDPGTHIGLIWDAKKFGPYPGK